MASLSPTASDISVCLLTYNHAHIIESTLVSILSQSITNFELIISDDCSTDGTWEKIIEFSKVDPRIRAIQTPGNSGMPGNANFAVKHSQRHYIALLHHDDIYRSDLLEKWAGVLDRHPDVAFVFNPYQVHGSDFVHQELMPSEDIDGRWILNHYLFPHWGCVVRGTAMIRRTAWQEIDGMREKFNMLADIDMWMRLAMRWNVGYVAEPLICVRNERPSCYPEEYKEISWSWRRQRYLYDIHASNRLEYLNRKTLSGRLQWWWFCCRLNFETMKWLGYGVVRKKQQAIVTSNECETPYDWWPLRAARRLLRSLQLRS